MKEVWAGGLGSLCFKDVPGFDGVLGIRVVEINDLNHKICAALLTEEVAV